MDVVRRHGSSTIWKSVARLSSKCTLKSWTRNWRKRKNNRRKKSSNNSKRMQVIISKRMQIIISKRIKKK